MIRIRTLITRAACFIVFASGTGAAHAQIGPNVDWFNVVAKMQPGQSLEQGNSKLTVNQRNGGTKDDSGWYLVSSVDGGFSARFPAPVNEATLAAEVEEGSVRMQLGENILLSETSTTRFTLVCLMAGQLKETAQNVDEIVKMTESHWRQFKSEPFTDPTHAGIQFSGIDEQGLAAAGQSFLLGDRFCQFLVVGFGKPFEGIPPEARTFFASFRPVRGTRAKVAPTHSAINDAQ